jgi:hypothetical protein
LIMHTVRKTHTTWVVEYTSDTTLREIEEFDDPLLAYEFCSFLNGGRCSGWLLKWIVEHREATS